jgi:Helix-turn-helix domain
MNDNDISDNESESAEADALRTYHDQDFYELLEVSSDATVEEIEAAYERLKGVFDSSSSATYMLFGDDEAGEMRRMLDAAYLTLCDERERARYDEDRGIKRTERIATRPTRVAHVTSSTSPIVQATIVDQPARDEEVTVPDAVAPTLTHAQAQAVQATPPSEATEAPPVATENTGYENRLAVVSGPAIDDNMEYSGGVLMRLRESKGVTLEAIAQRTKISLTHLRAIEANQYDKLPARVYVRGFVAQYAKFLSLNAERVCASYLSIYDRFVQAKSST